MYRLIKQVGKARRGEFVTPHGIIQMPAFMNVATAGVISSYVGGIIFFSILVIYLWAGGLRAVVMTDIFYGILIVLAIVSSGLCM